MAWEYEIPSSSLPGQESSSEPSVQSMTPSHMEVKGMHVFSGTHVNSPWLHTTAREMNHNQLLDHLQKR